MKVRIKLDHAKIKRIEEAMLDSAAGALEAVHTDLAASQTMPFNIGDMQDNQTFVDRAENGAVLITGAPQARRLYYHPEYNFQRGTNLNAGALWLEPYISGEKKDFVRNAFAEELRRRAGI